MARINKSFYKGSDLYNDGDVEQEILEYVKDSKGISEDDFIGNDFAKAYHLSPIRENILNWYPFKKNETALEVGAGCGAISGMLASRLQKVTSVELSLRRSSINYERNKSIDNLEIVVGNFNDIELEEKYDYVILNGVLEYAIMFTDTRNPFVDFLSKMASYLKPSGKFLIAIENKLGLKYFNGSSEDHTNNYFEGINNYTLGSPVRTFSKTELGKILEEVGFVKTKFYYPYPDYKFPSEIFSDDTINNMSYGKPVSNIEKDRMWLFDEKQVIQDLKNEKIMSNFANSFLVIASKNNADCNVLYAKLNSDRYEQFRIATVIKEGIFGKRKVVKKGLNDKSYSHIDIIEKTTNRFLSNRVNYLPAKKKAEELEYKFIDTENLSSVKGNYDVVKERIAHFFEVYFSSFQNIETDDIYTDEFIKWFGSEQLSNPVVCIDSANIDLIVDNVYLQDGKYSIIDCEWIYPGLVPKSFIVWRCINEAYYSGLIDTSEVSFEDMLRDFDIFIEEDKIYRKWANHFAIDYVGSYHRDRISVPVTRVSLSDIKKTLKNKITALMKLYLDYGDGFSEEHTVCKMVEVIDNHFDVEFIVPDHESVYAMRFDPVDDFFCKCKIEDLSDGLEIKAINCVAKEAGMDVFANFDPQYGIEGKCSIVRISGDLVEMSSFELKKYL